MTSTQPLLRLALFALLLAATAPATLSAQEAIAGRATDAGDGAPVAGAAIVLLDGSANQLGTTTTAEDGSYRIEVPGPGIYLLVIQLDGFASVTSSPLTVPNGETLSYDPSLTRRSVGGSTGGADEMDDATFIRQYMADTCQGTFVPGIHGILFGAVRNQASGDPLANIEVTVRWNDGLGFGQQARRTRSDASGFWFVCDVPAGEEVQVRAQAVEASAQGDVQRVTVRAGTMRNMDVQIPLSDPTQSGNLLGIVRDVDTNRPVIGASVRLRDANRTTTTNDRGYFMMDDVPSGVDVMEVEVIGYQEILQPIQVFGGRSQQLEVLASRQPLELDPILVTVRPRTWFSDRAGLETRMRIGAGHFMLREDIEERAGAFTLGDLMRNVPGARVRRLGGGVNGRYVIQLRQAANLANEACTPNLWIDNVNRGRDAQLFSDLVSYDIEAIEVYRGPAETPGEFSGGDARCGVVVVWTRRGFGIGG